MFFFVTKRHMYLHPVLNITAEGISKGDEAVPPNQAEVHHLHCGGPLAAWGQGGSRHAVLPWGWIHCLLWQIGYYFWDYWLADLPSLSSPPLLGHRLTCLLWHYNVSGPMERPNCKELRTASSQQSTWNWSSDRALPQASLRWLRPWWHLGCSHRRHPRWEDPLSCT